MTGCFYCPISRRRALYTDAWWKWPSLELTEDDGRPQRCVDIDDSWLSTKWVGSQSGRSLTLRCRQPALDVVLWMYKQIVHNSERLTLTPEHNNPSEQTVHISERLRSTPEHNDPLEQAWRQLLCCASARNWTVSAWSADLQWITQNVNDFYKAHHVIDIVIFSNTCTLSWNVMENRLHQVTAGQMLCVCLDVNQGCTTHNCCTQRLVILHAQTY